MPNYKEMYLKIFNVLTDTIEELQAVQQECEDIYVSEEPLPLELFKNENELLETEQTPKTAKTLPLLPNERIK